MISTRARLLRLICVAFVLAVALRGGYLLVERAHAAQSARYEADAIRQIDANILRLRVGMSMSSVYRTLWDRVHPNPNGNPPIHSFYSMDGRRSYIIEKPDHTYLVFECTVNYHAPLTADGYPRSDDGWILARFGASSKGYLS